MTHAVNVDHQGPGHNVMARGCFPDVQRYSGLQFECPQERPALRRAPPGGGAERPPGPRPPPPGQGPPPHPGDSGAAVSAGGAAHETKHGTRHRQNPTQGVLKLEFPASHYWGRPCAEMSSETPVQAELKAGRERWPGWEDIGPSTQIFQHHNTGRLPEEMYSEIL